MFKAICLEKNDTDRQPSRRIAELDDAALPEILEREVTVAVQHSTVNYKDALAMTGRSPVVRSYPMVPGIDLAGTVIDSEDSRWKVGDNVLVNGWGLGERHWGGLAQRARVDGNWLVGIPDALNSWSAMAAGTAGYTAMLCVMALEQQGVTPDAGDVLVTGATGGVGSFTVALLSKLGYRVIAATGKSSEAPYLTALGAAEVIDRAVLAEPGKPLQKERWAGAVDTLGSVTLANICASVKYGGSVAACGLAQGMDLPITVAPFILRGVRLIGVDSVMAPYAMRAQAWQRLAELMDLQWLNRIANTCGLAEAMDLSEKLLDGKVIGRVVIDVNA